MEQMQWGFRVEQTTSLIIISIFLLYSLFVVVMGYRVQRANKGLSSKDKVISFLTGGGGISSFGVAMLSLTGVFTGAVMIGNPGLAYGSSGGLIVAICVLVNMWGVFFMQGTLGKKLSIMKQRCGVDSIIQALRLRFNSPFLGGFLSLTMFAFLISYMSAQYMGGARMIAVLVGIERYWIGIMLIGVVTIIYSSAGGIKSMVRVAILQGILMMITGIVLFISGSNAIVATHGSWENAVQFVLATRATIYTPTTYTFLQAVGLSVAVSFSCTACIHALPATLTHDTGKTVKRGIIYATLGTPIVNFFMVNTGYLAYIMHPTLPSGDLASSFVAGALSPAIVGGIFLCGVVSAIQSSVAAFMLVAATCLVKDFYKDILRPKTTDDEIAKLMPIFTLLTGVLGILTALYPTELMATVNYFANGGMISGLWAPLVFGIHSKKVTPAGAIAGSISGIVLYIVTFTLYGHPATAATFRALTLNCNPNIMGLATSTIVMLVVSKYTRPVELGVAQVWFGKTYDEKYTRYLS